MLALAMKTLFCRISFFPVSNSGSVDPKTGWLPQHITCRDDNGELIGVVPLYLKGHSYGEYIFDWSWADAWERAGNKYFLNYYLQYLSRL